MIQSVFSRIIGMNPRGGFSKPGIGSRIPKASVRRNVDLTDTPDLKLELNSKEVDSTRGKRRGGFGQIISKLLGRRRPRAFVRKGREVSFDRIPFFDAASGGKLKIETVHDKNGRSKVAVRRSSGGIFSRRRTVRSDPEFRFEMELSQNRGVDQTVSLRKIVKNHLKATQKLRQGILTGKIETPGSKRAKLERKIVEAGKEVAPLQAILASLVKSHKGGKAEEANSAAKMKNSPDMGNKKANRAISMDDLPHPLARKVKKFEPSKVEVPEDRIFRNGKKKGTAKNVKASGRRQSGTKKDGREVGVEEDRILRGVKKNRSTKVVETPGRRQSGSVTGDLNKEKRNESRIVAELPVRKTTELPMPGAITNKDREFAIQMKAVREEVKQKTKGKRRVRSVNDVLIAKMREKDKANKQKSVISSPPEEATIKSTEERKSMPKSENAERAKTKAKRLRRVKARRAGNASLVNREPAEASIEKMERNGWRIHTPGSENGEASKISSSNTEQETAQIRRKRGDRSKNATGKNAKIEAETKSDANRNEQIPAPGVTDNRVKQNVKDSNSGRNVTMPDVSGQPATARRSKVETDEGKKTAGSSSRGLSQGIENLEEILKKIEGKARILRADGQTTLRIRLKPARLGLLFVQVKEKEGRYEVSMRVENPEAAKAIELQLPAIREQLSNAGVNLERFDVETSAQKFQAANEEMNGRKQRGRDAEGKENADSDGEAQRETRNRRPLFIGTNTVDYVG